MFALNTRRKRYCTVTAGLMVCGIALWYTLSQAHFFGPRPCKATFLQVREGMTMEEVIATVGGPPGDYRKSKYVYQTGRTLATAHSGTFWVADDEELILGFDDNNKVSYVGFMGVLEFRPYTP